MNAQATTYEVELGRDSDDEGESAELANIYEADWRPLRMNIGEPDEQDQPQLKRPKPHDTDMADLLELHEAGETVVWPEGLDERSARKLRHERDEIEEPPAKRLRMAKPERERNTDSTLGVASARVEPDAAVVPQRRIPPHQGWAFGPGHDLRLSDDLVWCRKCGRFGEERIKAGICIGGPCFGKEGRAHTQLNNMRKGLHPRTLRPMPPDVAFVRR